MNNSDDWMNDPIEMDDWINSMEEETKNVPRKSGGGSGGGGGGCGSGCLSAVILVVGLIALAAVMITIL